MPGPLFGFLSPCLAAACAFASARAVAKGQKLGKKLTLVSFTSPCSKILAKTSAWSFVPNSFSRRALEARSSVPWAPCLAEMLLTRDGMAAASESLLVRDKNIKAVHHVHQRYALIALPSLDRPCTLDNDDEVVVLALVVNTGNFAVRTSHCGCNTRAERGNGLLDMRLI